MKDTCPLCKKEIVTSRGQRVFGCGDCRKDIRAHNRKILKRQNKKTVKSTYEPKYKDHYKETKEVE